MIGWSDEGDFLNKYSESSVGSLSPLLAASEVGLRRLQNVFWLKDINFVLPLAISETSFF